MFDIKWIRDHPEAFDEGLTKRGLDAASVKVLDLDKRLRACQTALQEIKAQRNAASKDIGAAKGRGEDADSLIGEVATLKSAIQAGEDDERRLAGELDDLLAQFPNLADKDVPVGPDESANVELRRVGAPKSFAFEPKEHFDIGEALGLMDFEAAARMSGARFVVLKGALARLERALGAFMLDLQTQEFGYQEIVPPILVRDDAAFGTGQLPKFADDLFGTRKIDQEKVEDWIEEQLSRNRDDSEFTATTDSDTSMMGFLSLVSPKEEVRKSNLRAAQMVKEILDNKELWDRLWLIPTAEVPLTNLVREQILEAKDLPIRVTALTPCFRSEAGAAGKDTRGMIRQHQFDKVELVSITRPKDSDKEHKRMTRAAEAVLRRLKLPYRVVTLSTGDMGFAVRKTYDIEVWLPGQERYREISSCSNCGDFQARRMNARYRPGGGKRTEFVHTLNGSGLAVGRTLIAVLENYQRADGSVRIPKALHPYMGDLKVIEPDG